VYGPVRTVVWQGSAGNRCPYADLTRFSLPKSLISGLPTIRELSPCQIVLELTSSPGEHRGWNLQIGLRPGQFLQRSQVGCETVIARSSMGETRSLFAAQPLTHR